MSQHFLLTSAAKRLTLASVARLSDDEAEAVFRKIGWASNGGNPFCPKCGCTIVYDCRRANRTARWRCKACRYSFSITSGTLFHSRKMPLRAYLFAIAIFCNEVKGKSMLALSRDLGTHYMTAFVLAHKIREAMASEMRGVNIGGAGRKAEIDGGYFGGYVKPANRIENRRDRRLQTRLGRAHKFVQWSHGYNAMSGASVKVDPHHGIRGSNWRERHRWFDGRSDVRRRKKLNSNFGIAPATFFDNSESSVTLDQNAT
jgi:transposase-like protein